MAGGRVTILAIGVSQYKSLKPLRGPKSDLGSIEYLFSESDFSIHGKADVKLMEDPSCQCVRDWILEYASTRSALGDVLVFYFSGHGTVVGPGEFAFCCADTLARQDSGDVFPLSVVHFSDVVDTLTSVDVYPVFIIDACYAGAAAHSHAPATAMEQMHDTVHRRAGSSYAMLCACSARRTTSDDLDGGAFTKLLVDTLEQGLSDRRRQETIDLQDIFLSLQNACEKDTDLNAPRLYVGPSLPRFPLCRNAAFEELKYTFTGYMAQLVRAMWNNGKPKPLKTDQIRSFGAGPYGNHRKLSYAPWALLEDGRNSKERRLTQRGLEFAQGKLRVPQTIRAMDEHTTAPESWEPVPGAPDVGIADF